MIGILFTQRMMDSPEAPKLYSDDWTLAYGASSIPGTDRLQNPTNSMNDEEHPLKLLFVCSRNKLRSLTAEKLFEGFPLYQVRSAGTERDARIVITAGHIGWADIIFVMEKSHLDRISLKYPEAIRNKRVIALHIPDAYRFMEPELIDEFRGKLAPYIELPPESNSPPDNE